MKPIEPGCKCLIVDSVVPENIGRTVTVVKFIGKVFLFWGDDRWEIEERIKTDLGDSCNHHCEHKMMRIDGFDESLGVESNDLEACQ